VLLLILIFDRAERELLSARGLTQLDFQAILTEHQRNSALIEIFTQMQYDNKRILTKHGISMGM